LVTTVARVTGSANRSAPPGPCPRMASSIVSTPGWPF
jgi:hypothetical protein